LVALFFAIAGGAWATEATTASAPKTVSGFVQPSGKTFGHGFSVSHPGTGKYVITFPAGEFARFPGIGITGWGINGAVDVVNLSKATKEKDGSFKYVVYVTSTAGPLNLHDNGFAFVATEVSK
jgi:hypothetical protein